MVSLDPNALFLCARPGTQAAASFLFVQQQPHRQQTAVKFPVISTSNKPVATAKRPKRAVRSGNFEGTSRETTAQKICRNRPTRPAEVLSSIIKPRLRSLSTSHLILCEVFLPSIVPLRFISRISPCSSLASLFHSFLVRFASPVPSVLSPG